MPIRHQSGRSDISSDRGRTSPGSCPSTMEAPSSNQDGLHRIQVIQRTQEVFGRTLRNQGATGGRKRTVTGWSPTQKNLLKATLLSASRRAAQPQQVWVWLMHEKR